MVKAIKIPIRIDPDPIVDSVVEFRFETELPKESVFGIIFSHISKDFPNYKPTDIPLQIRKTFKDFQYTVEGILDSNEYSIGIGQQVIFFNCINGYKNWINYFPIIEKYLGIVFSLKIIKRIIRIGIRYVNFFENVTDISKNLTLQVNFEGKEDYITHNTTLRSTLSKDDFKHNLNISDDARVKNVPGSILDIDTFTENISDNNLKSILSIVEKGHKEEKLLFYYLLKPEFLSQLNPVYK